MRKERPAGLGLRGNLAFVEEIVPLFISWVVDKNGPERDWLRVRSSRASAPDLT